MKILMSFLLLIGISYAEVFTEIQEGNITKKYIILFVPDKDKCFNKYRGKFYNDNAGICYMEYKDYLKNTI